MEQTYLEFDLSDRDLFNQEGRFSCDDEIEDTRNEVTPYAFQVAQELTGKATASPWRRGVALLIDLTFIGLLSIGSMFINLPLIIGWLIYKRKSLDSKWNLHRKKVLSVIILMTLFTGGKRPLKLEGLEALEGVDFTSLPTLIEESSALNSLCGDECLENSIESSLKLISKSQLNKKDLRLVIYNNFLDKGLSEKSSEELSQMLFLLKDVELKSSADSIKSSPKDKSVLSQSNESNIIKNLLSLLGISVGWAALYFTFMLSWNEGQTLGKQILGIRVVRINNKPIGLWCSFNRYGGYAAGIATGLFGFLQIYWDFNRQSIQDQMAQTIVIKS